MLLEIRELLFCLLLCSGCLVPARGNTKQRCGGLAQLVEHLPCKQGVSGSIPLTSTKPLLKRTNGFIAQLVRAHA